MDGPFVEQLFAGRADVVGVHGTWIGRVPPRGGRGDVRGYYHFAGTRVCEVEGALVGGEGDAVGLRESVLDQGDLARVRIEAVCAHVDLGRLGVDAVGAAIVCRHGEADKRLWLGSCGGGRVTVVGEPDLASSIDVEIIYGVEVVAIIVVQQHAALARCHVEGV